MQSGHMLRYRFVNHTADMEFVAYGRNLSDVFKNALLALFDTIAYRSRLSSIKSEKITIRISAKGDDEELLLWSALQKALSVCDAKGVFAYDVSRLLIKKSDYSNYYLRAELIAKEKCQKCAKFDVKGISRYDMHVKHGQSIVKAYVVVDV